MVAEELRLSEVCEKNNMLINVKAAIRASIRRPGVEGGSVLVLGSGRKVLHGVLIVSIGLILSDNFRNIGQPDEMYEKFYVVGRLSAFDLATGLIAGIGVHYIEWLKRYFLRWQLMVAAFLMILFNKKLSA